MLKNGDFIKLEYDGYDEKGNVFDSTKGEIGKTLHGKDGPLLIVVGHYHMIRGLDEMVRSMKKGEEKEGAFDSNKAFGSRSKKMVKVLNLSDFKEHDVFPTPGLNIHLDSDRGRIFGTVKSVSGGRVLVDFNHPLADKKVRYRAKLVDVIETLEGKIKSLMDEVGIPGSFELSDKDLVFTLDKSIKDYEMKKATLVVMTRGFIPELKKIEVKETESGGSGAKETAAEQKPAETKKEKTKEAKPKKEKKSA